MKKKVIGASIIILILGLTVCIGYGYVQWKKARKEQIAEEIRLIDYWEQNVAFGMDASVWESGYQEYSQVDEEELYVRLEVYNRWNEQKDNGRERLHLSDIEDYLSSEYNGDGSFRVSVKPAEIEDYMEWYYGDGNGDVEEYWDELQEIMLNYYDKNPEIPQKTTGNLTTEQLQELINKYNDPNYEINAEIMGEQE